MNDSPGSRIRVFGHKTTGQQEDVKPPGEPPDQKHAVPVLLLLISAPGAPNARACCHGGVWGWEGAEEDPLTP